MLPVICVITGAVKRMKLWGSEQGPRVPFPHLSINVQVK